MNDCDNHYGELSITQRSFISGLSCKRFIAYAILLSLLFMAAHLLGFREYTGVLSGTVQANIYHQFFGAVYIVLYTGFSIVVPVLLIASVLTEIIVFLIHKNK